MRLGTEAKYTSKKYDRNRQRKNKTKKTRKKKKKRRQLQRLKAAEKLVLTNPFARINNKASNVLDAQVEKNHKNLETKDVVNL